MKHRRGKHENYDSWRDRMFHAVWMIGLIVFFLVGLYLVFYWWGPGS